MAKQDKTPLTPARQKASRKYYEKNSATISNKNKIDRIEKEIQFNLVRQGTTKAQQHFLRKMLLDQFAVILKFWQHILVYWCSNGLLVWAIKDGSLYAHAWLHLVLFWLLSMMDLKERLCQYTN
ncbi:hypothetical protein V8B55DRAFT_1562077 [Mucor lusitanicus]|uniref:Uncharacterized protein n=1 Tax=Mucor circinelloides f. lusitanicus TaxID=29924 RepID=A0A8H4F480_MUCCL|nr:hypothetical protein FB192DRAFT_1340282 [Mucor lusitanicus]